MNNEITLGVLMFTAVVLSLVAIILVARAQLVSSGAVTISINDDPESSIVGSTSLLGGSFCSRALSMWWWRYVCPVSLHY